MAWGSCTRGGSRDFPRALPRELVQIILDYWCPCSLIGFYPQWGVPDLHRHPVETLQYLGEYRARNAEPPTYTYAAVLPDVPSNVSKGSHSTFSQIGAPVHAGWGQVGVVLIAGETQYGQRMRRFLWHLFLGHWVDASPHGPAEWVSATVRDTPLPYADPRSGHARWVSSQCQTRAWYFQGE